MWVNHWPLKKERLEKLQNLVQQQLEAGHTELSSTPIFVVPKKTGKWRLIHDLRKINEILEPRGALQPGVPNPACIPKDWPLSVIDLKDCSFTTPLAKKDLERFAFSVPVFNNSQPLERFRWKVLPQGMLNSPTICQHFVHQVVQPVQTQFPQSIIYHYIDDILIAAASQEELKQVYLCLEDNVSSAGLVIEPWKRYSIISPKAVFRICLISLYG